MAVDVSTETSHVRCCLFPVRFRYWCVVLQLLVDKSNF